MLTLLRLLCAIVDWLIPTVASQIVLIGLFNMPLDIGFTAVMAFMMTYVVYHVLFTRYMNGQTPGKAIGRLIVVTKSPPEEREPSEFHELVLRESCKAMYFFPIVGWAAGLLAIGALILNKEPLHDKMASTQVRFIRKGA